jgi:hypothetical protein
MKMKKIVQKVNGSSRTEVFFKRRTGVMKPAWAAGYVKAGRGR